jgi:hypothetical protein
MEHPTRDADWVVKHMEQAHGIHIPEWQRIAPILAEYIACVALRAGNVAASNAASKPPTLQHLMHARQGDLRLRERLFQAKLLEMLQLQTHERTTQSLVPHDCLFCRTTYANRAALWEHMSAVHGFFCGHFENMVNVASFLHVLREHLTAAQCIYCHRTFDSRAVLAKHMRKWKHFAIHPQDAAYHPYYLANYGYEVVRDPRSPDMLLRVQAVVPGGDTDEGRAPSVASSASVPGSLLLPHSGHLARDEENAVDDDDNWGDWDETVELGVLDASQVTQHTMQCRCVLEDAAFEEPEQALEHMRQEHGLDLLAMFQPLSVYARIRLVNYMRRKAVLNQCFACEQAFEEAHDMCAHFQGTEGSCSRRPPPSHNAMWSDPQYLFPAVEGDSLLMYVMSLDGDGDDDDGGDVASPAKPFTVSTPMQGMPPGQVDDFLRHADIAETLDEDTLGMLRSLGLR